MSASLISFCKYDLPVSYFVFKANPLVLILFIATNLSHTVFLTKLLFTTLLNLLKSTGTVFNLVTSILSASAFKLAKSDFASNLDVITPVSFFESVLLHN